MTDDAVCLQVTQAVLDYRDLFCIVTVQVRLCTGCEEDGQVCEQPHEAHGQQGGALRKQTELNVLKTNTIYKLFV